MYIVTSLKNHVRTIKMNRPERRNAMNYQMYKAIGDILNEDASNDDIAVTIITSTGDYFSSGNDIRGVFEQTNIENEHAEANVLNMVEAFINYPKVLIAVVNGPCIGIGATMPALCDIIYASDKASFDTPFIRLGLCAEACSSFTYPFSLGRSKASELILLNHKLSAQEAYHFGLVSKVFPHTQLDQFIEDLHKHGDLSVQGIIINKKLVMDNFRNILHECAEREGKQLHTCLISPEFVEQVQLFFTKKSKL